MKINKKIVGILVIIGGVFIPAKVYAKPVTLKWIQVGANVPKNYDKWIKQINPYLEKKINVNIDMEIIPLDKWNLEVDELMEKKDDFDICFTSNDRYANQAEKGLFMDITEKVNKDDVLKYSIPEDFWEASKIFGKIYGVPTYKDSSTAEYFIWDSKAAKEVNIATDKVTNFESLYKALKKVKEKYPDKEPFFLNRKGVEFLIDNYYDDLGTMLPVIGVKYDDKEMKIVNPLDNKEIVNELKYVHKMYEEGIINKDAAEVYNNDNREKMFMTSKDWTLENSIDSSSRNMIQNYIAVQFGPSVVSNASIQNSINGISSTSKKADAALKLLYLVNNDTRVRDWLMYGVQGENFKYEKDDKIIKINSDWSLAGYSDGTFFNLNRVAQRESRTWDAIKDMNLGAKKSVMIGFTANTKNVTDVLGNCIEVYRRYAPMLFTGVGEPESTIENMKKDLKAAGYDKVVESMQNQVNNFKK